MSPADGRVAARLGGVIAPVLTPFTADGSFDEPKFRAEVAHLVGAGVHGLSPGGSTGEGAALTDDELARMVTICRADGGGRPVVAGVIRASTQAAAQTARRARDAGADALMVTPTFYNVLVPDDAGNRAFYQSLSDEVGLPIIIYNVVPQNQITSEAAAELLSIEHVVGIKQSVGGIMALYDMLRICGDRGWVYAATDEMLASCFQLGADGAISAIVALLPEHSLRMWDLVQEGDHAGALAIQNQLYPVWRLVRGAQFPARMKAAAAAMGRDCGYARSPLGPVPPTVRAALADAASAVQDVPPAGPMSTEAVRS